MNVDCRKHIYHASTPDLRLVSDFALNHAQWAAGQSHLINQPIRRK